MKLAIVKRLESIRTGFEFRLRLSDGPTFLTNPAIIVFYKSLVTEKFKGKSIKFFFLLFIITKNKTATAIYFLFFFFLVKECNKKIT